MNTGGKWGFDGGEGGAKAAQKSTFRTKNREKSGQSRRKSGRSCESRTARGEIENKKCKREKFFGDVWRASFIAFLFRDYLRVCAHRAAGGEGEKGGITRGLSGAKRRGWEADLRSHGAHHADGWGGQEGDYRGEVVGVGRILPRAAYSPLMFMEKPRLGMGGRGLSRRRVPGVGAAGGAGDGGGFEGGGEFDVGEASSTRVSAVMGPIRGRRGRGYRWWWPR